METQQISLPMQVLARKIARTMLFILATTFRSKPYQWACKMYMHIYNDNRMMLGKFSHRMRVTAGFIEKFKHFKLEPDYIFGTSTAGIAPAASLAQILGLHLIVCQDEIYYKYNRNLLRNPKLLKELKLINPETIVVIGTEAIPYGVQYANKFKTGFAYKRNSPKSHGKKQEIEGDLKEGMRIAILYLSNTGQGENYESDLVEKFINDGYDVSFIGALNITKEYNHYPMTEDEFLGKIIVVIEDLFSTGASAAKNVYGLRKIGAICNHCFSIFSYGFETLKKQFSGEKEIGDTGLKLDTPCQIDSLLPFSMLENEMERLNIWKIEKRQAMHKEIAGFDSNYKIFLETGIQPGV